MSNTPTAVSQRELWIAEHADLCKRMAAITKRKNADYTGDSDDPFANFKVIESLGAGITAEQGMLTRMSDKMSRIATLLDRPPQVQDESIEDTLLDLANYALLMIGLRRQRGHELEAELAFANHAASKSRQLT